ERQAATAGGADRRWPRRGVRRHPLSLRLIDLPIPPESIPYLRDRHAQTAADEDRLVVLIGHRERVVGRADDLQRTAATPPALDLAADMDRKRAVIAARTP